MEWDCVIERITGPRERLIPEKFPFVEESYKII